MQVKLNSITGVDDAIVALHQSKRTLTPELEQHIRKVVSKCTLYGDDIDPNGAFYGDSVYGDYYGDYYLEFDKYMDSLLKWGKRHITLLKFIDLSFTVYDIHRGAQDDIDSHAKRMDNRIIRASTRLADFKSGEMSDYYKGKIIPTDEALKIVGVELPEKLEYNCNTYVRAVNGYILEDYKNNKDVKRGLYMLSIPSTFNFKVNLAEFAHIYKERNNNSSANPEVKQAVEEMAQQLDDATDRFITKEYLLEINN